MNTDEHKIDVGKTPARSIAEWELMLFGLLFQSVGYPIKSKVFELMGHPHVVHASDVHDDGNQHANHHCVSDVNLDHASPLGTVSHRYRLTRRNALAWRAG